jgi:RNA polymerase sigma-70 factor (ECF subfamily)
MKRKEKPMQALQPQDEMVLAGRGSTPAEAAMDREHEEAVPRLLQQLPERQQEAVRLKFQQSLSYREIAEVMKISESNVGFLIHMGVKALREQMKKLQGVVS